MESKSPVVMVTRSFSLNFRSTPVLLNGFFKEFPRRKEMNEDYRWNPPFNEIFLWPPASPKSFPLPFGHTPRVSDSVAQLEYSRAFPWILMFVSGREKKIKKEENHPQSSCLIRHFDGRSRYRSVRGPPSGLPSELCRIWALTIGKHISSSFKRNVYRKTNKQKKAGKYLEGSHLLFFDLLSR